jgi:4-diphosphocytidyl-2-C-methyl-D-erythritol kinase
MHASISGSSGDSLSDSPNQVCCGLVGRSRHAVVVQSPAKLNIFLEVCGKRPDGYHELDTVMVRTTFCDTLTVMPRDDQQLRLRFSDATTESLRHGVPLDHNNLILKAALKLREFYGVSPQGADFILHKQIPPESGLGGGSGNAAAALLACRTVWNLSATDADLHSIAASLGSDINFLLSGCPAAVCRGRGEQIFPIPMTSRLFFVAVRPAQGNSTPDVFRRTRIPETPVSSTNIAQCLADGSTSQLDKFMFNRLTQAACEANPEMAELISRLQHLTRLPVFMSGSGSTVFLRCRSSHEARRLQTRVQQQLRVTAWYLEV